MGIDNNTTLIEFVGKKDNGIADYKKFKLDDLKPQQTFSGKPQVKIFTNDGVNENNGKEYTYDSIRVRVIDDDSKEYLDCYANFPKPDAEGWSHNISKGFSFYRKAFDFIASVLYKIDALNIIDPETNEQVNVWEKIKVQQVVDYVNTWDNITVTVLPGTEDDNYNSFKVQ